MLTPSFSTDLHQKVMPASESDVAPQVDLPLLRLREDLQFSYQQHGEQPGYLIEDPLNGHFYRIGTVEYALLQRLDGQTETADLLNDFRQLPIDQMQMLVRWLLVNQLAYLWQKEQQRWVLPNPPKDNLQVLGKRLNTLFIRIPLGSPDRLIERILPFFDWMPGWSFFMLWLLVCGSAVYLVAAHFERFQQSASSLLIADNLLWLALAWALVKIIHEFAHGLVCKRYGGHVHQAGILLILFMPIGGYVDATSSWRLRSRWQRMHVSVAGMYVELFIAGVATWVWAHTETGPLNYLSYNMVLITSMATVLFNANPLMRFDGYYILCDWMDVPNLYTSGARYIRYLGRRYVQGRQDESPPQWPSRVAWFIKAYGIASFLWRWLVVVGLIVLALNLFYGAGVVMAAGAAITIFVLPLLRFAKQLQRDPARSSVLRLLLLWLLLAGSVMTAAWLYLPWSPTLSAPAVIEYADSVTVRSESSGFVQQIAVHPGDQVRAGQLLVVLNNPPLQTEQTELQLKIKIHELRRQSHLLENDPSAAQLEQMLLRDLQEKLKTRTRQVEALTIRAPSDGMVITPDLRPLQGAFLQRGDEVLLLADPLRVEVNISIDQNLIESFRAQQGKKATLYRYSEPLQPYVLRFDQVQPGAFLDIRYPSLTVPGGGSLAVRPRAPSAGKAAGDPMQGYEHLTPRFYALATFETLPDSPLRHGEVGKVIIESPPRPLGYWISAAWQRYWQRIADSVKTGH